MIDLSNFKFKPAKEKIKIRKPFSRCVLRLLISEIARNY
jgi:hypothetical protein